MTWRALIVGDVHLRTDANTDDTVAALQFAARTAREYAVDAVLFGGDIYEGRSDEEQRDLFADVIRSLAGIPVYGIAGNHDRKKDVKIFNLAPGNVWLERPEVVEAGPVDLLMIPWPARAFLAAAGFTGEAADQAGSAALAAMMRATVAMRQRPAAPLILNAHLQVLGSMTSSAQPLVGKSVEAVLGDLLDLGLAAGFISHVHRPQELAPNLWVPGSIVVHDHGEESETKRIGLLTIDDDGTASVEWVTVPCRRWVTIEACLEEPNADGSGGGLLLERLQGQAWADAFDGQEFTGANVRYRFECDESEQHLFDKPTIRRRFSSAHTLKIESEITRATASRDGAAEVAAARSTAEKLRAWGTATGTEITPSLLAKLATLEEESHA